MAVTVTTSTALTTSFSLFHFFKFFFFSFLSTTRRLLTFGCQLRTKSIVVQCLNSVYATTYSTHQAQHEAQKESITCQAAQLGVCSYCSQDTVQANLKTDYPCWCWKAYYVDYLANLQKNQNVFKVSKMFIVVIILSNWHRWLCCITSTCYSGARSTTQKLHV